jgi:hypothetical protein
MIRPSLTAAAAVTLLLLGAAPALAGKAEDNFLAKLVGIWSGSGTLTGDETGTVDCTMTIRTRSEGVNFRGKCDAGEFGPQSFSGSVAYNEEMGRYEAKSPSGEVTLGVKEGSSVVFTIALKGIATGTSVMKLSSSKAVIDTIVRRPGGKGDIKSHMVLTK